LRVHASRTGRQSIKKRERGAAHFSSTKRRTGLRVEKGNKRPVWWQKNPASYGKNCGEPVPISGMRHRRRKGGKGEKFREPLIRKKKSSPSCNDVARSKKDEREDNLSVPRKETKSFFSRKQGVMPLAGREKKGAVQNPSCLYNGGPVILRTHIKYASKGTAGGKRSRRANPPSRFGGHNTCVGRKRSQSELGSKSGHSGKTVRKRPIYRTVLFEREIKTILFRRSASSAESGVSPSGKSR